MDKRQLVYEYHERTKHNYHRYAPAQGYLDWDNQPDPFRRFIDAHFVPLVLPDSYPAIEYDQLYSPQLVPTRPVSLETLSEFFFYSLALSAWKQYQESSWSLRVNPSSGNLHPTEGYLLINRLNEERSQPGLYHYAPKEHGLELRAEFQDGPWHQLMQPFSKDSFFVGLSSIHWRESWKYGERAFRYCQHDVGHAYATVCLSAALLGWRVQRLSIATDDLAQLLSLDHVKDFVEAESETPDLLAVVSPSLSFVSPGTLPDGIIRKLTNGIWFGQANRLSENHHPWEVIDEVSDACIQTKGECRSEGNYDPLFRMPKEVTKEKNQPLSDANQTKSILAGQVIRQRRSAVDMDGITTMPRPQFYEMLSRVMPKKDSVIWNSISQEAFVHLGLFVHRVDDMVPGLYFLARDLKKLPLLQASLHAKFKWEAPPGCPETLPLFLLEEKDVQGVAAAVSCGQNIAGDGVFSCGMLAEFEEPIRRLGAYWYRYLFWETGMIGQIFYLEAEAKGIQATGIGCFFDDPVHEVFGIQNHTFQSLYHFTVGGAVEDHRLSTLPSYQHLGSTSIL